MKLNTNYINAWIQDKNYGLIDRSYSIHYREMDSEKPFREWIDYPTKLDLSAITTYVDYLKKENQVMVVIGTGGSYMGTQAAIDMLTKPGEEKIYFVGPRTDTRYLNHVLSVCMEKDVVVNIISKSGGTMEISIYSEIFERFLKDKYGDCWNNHICCTTSNKGLLYEKALANDYQLFYLPDNIGGRFSVISAVGLLPLAFAGVDIRELVNGALKARELMKEPDNEAYQYARIRNELYQRGYKVEMFVSYFSYFNSFIEWLKQLFGESEGKDQKGILPGSLEYPKDLHSLGQYMQDGERIVFETQFNIKHTEPVSNMYIDESKFQNFRNAIVHGTAEAHRDGNVPVLVFDVERLDAWHVGYMFYFFEIACAMSAYLLGVNPFNQPGVERYKQNMKTILNEKNAR